MPLVHSYRLNAREGQEEALFSALDKLAATVREITGSQGAMVLEDARSPGKYAMLEFWDTAESRAAAGAQLPREVMNDIMAAIAGPIDMALYNRRSG